MFAKRILRVKGDKKEIFRDSNGEFNAKSVDRFTIFLALKLSSKKLRKQFFQCRENEL